MSIIAFHSNGQFPSRDIARTKWWTQLYYSQSSVPSTLGQLYIVNTHICDLPDPFLKNITSEFTKLEDAKQLAPVSKLPIVNQNFVVRNK